MSDMNYGFITGNLTSDAKISVKKTGQRYGRFEVEQRYLTHLGKEVRKKFLCFTSEDQILKMQKAGKASKGSYVFVRGTMDPSEYTTPHGEKITGFSLKACSVTFEEGMGPVRPQPAPVRKDRMDFSTIRETCDDDFFQD